MKRRLTYRSSGVDVAGAGAFIRSLRPLVERSKTAGAIGSIGNFGGLFRFSTHGRRDPILVSSTDGVGTKLKLAFLLDRHDTVGIDLVAMNVNDILCTGARPLFFLDYIACGNLDSRILTSVIRGVVEGCRQSGCALIGGETAQMPDFYKTGEYDLAGFGVGVVERARLVDGRTIRPGDVAVGLASSGLHSNGYTLARRVFGPRELRGRIGRTLLMPTRIYVKPVLKLLEKFRIKGIAHITGGSFFEKVPRILPARVALKLNLGAWPVPEIFREIQQRAGMGRREMFGTFNMGIGMVLVVRASDAAGVRKSLAKSDLPSWIVGRIVKGNGRVLFE